MIHRIPRSLCDSLGFRRFPDYPQVSIGCHSIPQESNGSHRIPQDYIGFHRIPQDSIGFHRVPQGSIGFHEGLQGFIGIHRATRVGGTSFGNYAGVMRELCGIDEPRVLQESRRIFMNASEPMGIVWGFIQTIPMDFIRIPYYSIGLHRFPQDSIG